MPDLVGEEHDLTIKDARDSLKTEEVKRLSPKVGVCEVKMFSIIAVIERMHSMQPVQ